MLINVRIRTKAIVMVLLLAIYSSAGLSASQAQVASMQSPDANAWKGLVPLRSTRRDVEALLGPPATGTQSFETAEATVFIEYVVERCAKGFVMGWNVARDTVLSIVVSPKEPVMFADLKIDKNKYLKSKDSPVDGRIFYSNSGDGINLVVDAITGKVRSFIYLPTEAQHILLCPAVIRLPARQTQADPFVRFNPRQYKER